MVTAQKTYITEHAEGKSLDELLSDTRYLLCLIQLHDDVSNNISQWKAAIAAASAVESIMSAQKDSN